MIWVGAAAWAVAGVALAVVIGRGIHLADLRAGATSDQPERELTLVGKP